MVVNNINITQTNVLIKSLNSDQKEENKSNDIFDSLKSKTSSDILDISRQVEILETAQNKKIDYGALERKLGIDSNQWGVEAVSNDIFDFVKIVYENYKMNHSEEDSQEVLDKFYDIAKSSVTQGYEEAMGFISGASEDVKTLAEGTYNRTIEKLDEWYSAGGVESKETELVKKEDLVSNDNIIKAEKPPVISTKELLNHAEELREQVVQMLEKQGIYLEEMETKKPALDIRG